MLLYANMVAAKPTAKTLEIATVFILSWSQESTKSTYFKKQHVADCYRFQKFLQETMV
jgi:hypothetical protein